MRVERNDVDYSVAPTYLSEVKSLITWDYFCYREYKDERAFDSIIDVGCNTGTLSVFARVLFPFSKIYSFDASPAAISRIEESINTRGSLFEFAQGLLPFPGSYTWYGFFW